MGIDPQDTRPLYLLVKEDIRKRLKSGKLKAGDKLSTHRELAGDYGVSLITVKRAVAELVQDGVIHTRAGKGSYVTRSADSVTGIRKGSTIGLVLRDLHSPFFSMIMQEVERAAYNAGFSVLFSNSSGLQEKEDEQINHFRRIGVQGLIIASMQHLYRATPLIRSLMREHFPLVMVSYNHDADVPFVGTDHERGGFIATEHLILTGRKRIAYINGERGNLVGELRKRGYQEALVQYGHDIDLRLQYRLRRRGGSHDYQSGAEIGTEVLKKRRKPDAVFIYNDLAALGFRDVMYAAGVKIPDEIAIVGFDDIERGRYTQVPLSTVRQPVDEIGRKAIETIISKVEGHPTPTRVILPPTLVVRASSAPAGSFIPDAKTDSDKQGKDDREIPPVPDTLPAKAS